MRDLRPLGAGELLDRAVTLFVRRFVPIVVVLAVVYVPFGIVEWLLIGPVLQHMESFSNAPGHHIPVSRDPFAIFGPGGAVRFAASMVLQTVVLLLTRTALVDTLGAAYAGESRALGDAYAVALRRWPAQLLSAVLSALLGLVLAVAWVMGFVVLALLFGALGKVPAAILGVVVGLTLFSVVVAIAAWIYIGAQLATVEIAGGSGPFGAFSYGLSVAFGQATRWRALVAALVIGAVALGGELLAAVLGNLIAGITHVMLLNFAIGTVIGIVLEGLITAFIVIYAVDVKVRRQGLDLVLETA